LQSVCLLGAFALCSTVMGVCFQCECEETVNQSVDRMLL
jgi:hypothetical protein